MTTEITDIKDDPTCWITMWVIALALFIVAKWITISNLGFTKHRVGRLRLLQYAFLWPGMNSRSFCYGRKVALPLVREWAFAGAKTFAGACLLWFGVRLIPAIHPLVIGWLGMIGLVLLIHFGLFHLLSLLWRTLGINAKPIMQSPATATSLGEFWGGRWNSAFTDLMQEQLFRPMARRIGARQALCAIFLISGFLHELVISVPANGGFGLPTLYFSIQGCGLLLERSQFGRHIGLGSGWKGWTFVAVVSGVPALWLFHSPFVHRVILPMLHAFGAI